MPLILLVDDEDDIRWSLKRILKNEAYEFGEAGSGREALAFLQHTVPDLVILDLRMSEMDGLQTMEALLQIEQNLPILILTGVEAVKSAVQAMKLGAVDYLVKPVDHDELRMVVRKTLEDSRLKREVAELRKQVAVPSGLVLGTSAVMRNLHDLVKSLAVRDVNVMIQGESGTGKQLVAETLHQLSPRQNGPFVTVDCGALPETLMESEFFGHEKGSFTGAVSRKTGKLEVAKGGTLFLDEISNLSLPLQAKLLRVLESRQFERVGSTTAIRADFRLITASNANVREMVQKGEFRSDLYYRINVFTLEVPPLRRHREDIPELVDHYLRFFNKKHGKKVEGVSPDCTRLFLEYYWPGNIRQLRNVLEHAVLLAGSDVQREHLPVEVLTDRKTGEAATVTGAASTIHLPSLEERALREALIKHGGDKTRAAAELGISLRTLYYWLKRHNISTKTLQ
jgi:DNA-binding NtrC family response regulator